MASRKASGSSSLLGLIRDMRENSGYISKLRKLGEAMDTDNEVEIDDLLNFWYLASDLLAVIKEDGSFIAVNNSWAKLTGYDKNDLIGANIYDFMHHEDVDKLDESIQKDNIEVSFRFQNKAKSYINLQWKAQLSDGKCYVIARLCASETHSPIQIIENDVEVIHGYHHKQK
jgi:PAS domain-containing protein